ncbi:MAG: hypothetical protein JW704_13390 [Anaerolineaceae bacterium]|nr:hypothetical protein [Anaerolineaceae bacterium]MBN2678397.1 hypothetical protein [Anaerolineaceae bacterium]
MKRIALLVVLASIFGTGSGCTSVTGQRFSLPFSKPGGLSVPENLSPNVIEICKVEGKLECLGDCLDGFDATCFYDTTQYQPDKTLIPNYFSEETKNICFAIHSSSVCGACHNTFELRKDGVLKQVSCEEFYQAIEDMNAECGNCLDRLWSGCC